LAHAVLRSALSEARRLQLVTINAAELVKVPTPVKAPIHPLDVDQAGTFLKVAAKQPPRRSVQRRACVRAAAR